jgi:hypothetical protein
MSFWAESPGPHWSDWFGSMVSCSSIPFLLPLRRGPLPYEEGHVRRAGKQDCVALAAFLQQNFTVAEKSRCVITDAELKALMGLGTIFGIFMQGSVIIGSIASRPLGECMFQKRQGSKLRRSRIGNSGFIDFYCVRRDIRGSKYGSVLLRWIDMVTSHEGRSIHFFQKELTPLVRLPPLWAGRYLVRERTSMESLYVSEIRPDIHHWPVYASMDLGRRSNLQIGFRPRAVSARSDVTATHLYRYKNREVDVYLTITDTFHEGTSGEGRLGEVLSVWPPTASPAAVEEILDTTRYSVLLMDSTLPHERTRWTQDSAYYIYAYNVNPRTFFTVRPWFWF